MSLLPWQAERWQQCFADPARLPHALLISGRSGIGKFAFARLLGKALLCEAPAPGFLPCGRCVSCQWFEQEAHPDFRLLQPASMSPNAPESEGEDSPPARDRPGGNQISVKQVRAVLADFVGFTAHRLGRKIVLVHPAEDLNVNAGNALLKSLEEPPSMTMFLLVTHRPHRVLATIRSRCCILPMRTPSASEGAAWLAQEGVEEPRLALSEAGFAPLQALQNARGEHLARRRAFLGALAGGNLDPVAYGETAAPDELPKMLTWLQKWTYDLVAAKCSGRVRYNPDFAERIASIADRSEVRLLTRFHRRLLSEQASVHHPLNPRLVLERSLIGYLQSTCAIPARRS
jgi:DNA polymerase-3 subunit delta'